MFLAERKAEGVIKPFKEVEILSAKEREEYQCSHQKSEQLRLL